MAKVVGIHNLELQPGVKAKDFEKFFREEWLVGTFDLSGVKTLLLKGDKGKRDGKYLMMIEFDSFDDRSRLFIDEAETTEEVKQMWQQWKKLRTFVSTEFTDYVELYE